MLLIVLRTKRILEKKKKYFLGFYGFSHIIPTILPSLTSSAFIPHGPTQYAPRAKVLRSTSSQLLPTTSLSTTISVCLIPHGFIARATLGRDNAVLVMAGMASVVAAGNKTLLASIALVAETTGASSIIPSLVASTVSYYVSGRSSFYRDVQPVRELEEEKPFFKILSDLGRTRLLYRIRVRDVMTRDVCLISEEETISNAINLLKKAPEEPCFVVDSSGNILGEVVLPELLALPEDKWGMSLAFAPLKKPEVVSEDTPLKELIEKMVETGKSHFLVMNDEGKISGCVSWIILLTRLDEVIKSRGEKRP
jgi:CBS domain-containing protein